MASRQKPWDAPFDDLIDDLSGRWDADVRRPEPQLGGEQGAGYFAYPKLRATVNRHTLEVEISDLPLTGSSESDRAANAQYLRLFVPCPLEHKVLVRHEGFLDRVAKAFRMTWEFQTGNDAFDRKYFLNSEKGQALDWICEADVQATIEALEPLTALRIYEHGIQWSRELKHGSDLDAANVADVGEKLVELSVLLRENPF